MVDRAERTDVQQQTPKTLTQSELVKRVVKATHLAQEEVEATLGAVLATIINAVAEGREVELMGFGTFKGQDRKKRVGKNPKTGAPVIVDAKRLPRFQPGNTFKLSVNQVGR